MGLNSSNSSHPDDASAGSDTERNTTTATRVRASVDWADAFLKALEETGVIVKAAEAAKISRSAVWDRRQKDSEFRERFELAVKAGGLLLEAEATRRAVDGVRRMKFNPKTGDPYIDPETKKPYIEHEYSDQLMALMLKRIFPEHYKEKPPEVSVTQSLNQSISVVPVEQLRAIQARRRIALQYSDTPQ